MTVEKQHCRPATWRRKSNTINRRSGIAAVEHILLYSETRIFLSYFFFFFIFL
jgi:hypothetical protein